MFNTFPREVGLPRKVINTQTEMLRFINLCNGRKTAVYFSIYSFSVVSENSHGKIMPDYQTAIVDKLFFDFDDKSCDAWKECNTFHQDLKEKNIKHIIVMSGRGYHLYILTLPLTPKNHKACIYNAQHEFIDALNLKVDAQVIGNPAQLARVPNTFNIKGHRFCIPLTEEQFNQGDEAIKDLAHNQNFVKYISIGTELLDIKQFDCEKKNNNETLFDIQESNVDFENLEYFKTLPPCVKALLSKEHIGWKDRYLIILYFKEKGYSKEEVFQILKTHLSEQKLVHCIQEERQLQYLFDRHDLLFPNCDNIMSEGLCNTPCKVFNHAIYK